MNKVRRTFVDENDTMLNEESLASAKASFLWLNEF